MNEQGTTIAPQLAVLIDTDNPQASVFQELLAELGRARGGSLSAALTELRLLAEVLRYGAAAIKPCSKSPAQCRP